MNSSDRHGGGAFTRLNFARKPTEYYMNEAGAEYAALYNITRGLLGKVTVWNACHLIRMWHFHLAPKMHNSHGQWPVMTDHFGGGYLLYEDFGPRRPSNGVSMKSNSTVSNHPSARVPTPSFFAPFCPDNVACYVERPLLDQYVNLPQEDASMG
jgi:hypothetical protein